MRNTLFFFLLSSILCVSQAQAPTRDKSNIDHTFHSEVFDKDRTVRVFLPERYFRDSISTYPVVYVLDAQSDLFWNMAKGNIGYMVDNYAAIPMIVVGIVSDSRGEEFEPPANNLQSHFKNEVFPLIEDNYRTDAFKIVIGHSWGGAFIGTTLFSKNKDLFDGYIGISPSFGDTDNIIVRDAETLLKNNEVFKKYLYFSHGNVGRRELEFKGYVDTIDALTKLYPNESLVYQPRLIDGVDHWQIVGPSICDGLISLSRNYFADQKVIEDMAIAANEDLKERITNFNTKQKAMFGYIHEASAGYLNFVANDFRDLDDYSTALTLYSMAAEKSPNDVKCHVNICDIYDKQGDTKKAKVKFASTIRLLEEQKDNVSKNYYNDVLKWLKGKLDGYE